MSIINSIANSYNHIFELSNDSLNLSIDLKFDEVNYHPYFGWKYALIPLFLPAFFLVDLNESIDFHGNINLNIDDNNILFENIHGTCEFYRNGIDSYPEDMHYSIYNSSNELIFEFDSHKDSVLDENIIHGNISLNHIDQFLNL
jgi:hypothetical protein